MAKRIDEIEETAAEETAEAPAKAKLEPGQARIKFLFDSYSQDWGPPELHKQGKEMVVDAEKAKTLAKEYGGPTRGKQYREGKEPLPGDKITDLGCPFEIIEGNKAVGAAPSTK